MHFQKDYSVSLCALSDWLRQMEEKIEAVPEVKLGLFEKKSQLARLVFEQ